MKNDPLLLEIQEEISRENMVRFVNKYGKLLAAAIIAAFLAVAAYQAYKHFRASESEAAGTEIYTIMRDFDQSQDEFVTKKLDETAKAPGYKEISLLTKAQVFVKKNDFISAVATFDELAKDTSAEKGLRDLAALNAANLLLNTNPKAEGLEKRLTGLTAEDNTFRYNAMELLATYYMQNGDQAKADGVLEKLAADANAPATVSKRARELSPNIKEPTAAPADEE